MDFKDKIVIVTGGSRGIGKAIVSEFSRRGASVFFTYQKNNEAASYVAETYNARAYQCSQTNNDQIEQTLDSVLEKSGYIDILVNNAGIKADKYCMMMSFDEWNKIIDTNINGAYRWSKAVSRSMLSRKSGTIVNIASVSGMVGIAGQTNYAASKGAILAFNRSLASELGPKGIRVNAVVPGFIDTDMTAVIPRHIKRQNIERILLQRFGKPEEVAKVVAFLASENA